MTDWSQVVQQHGPLVWRTAQRLLRNEPDAADCFQRTFVSALELARTQAVHNWPGLLRRLATVRALEQLRQKRRDYDLRSLLPEDGGADARAVNPLQAATDSELAEHLREALTDLEPRQGQVFCLACLDGCSYQEIAEQFDISVNHVGVLLNRARENLRQRLWVHRPVAAGGKLRSEDLS
jgi:RNA polymerase sigma factor (sigma-70 family)